MEITKRLLAPFLNRKQNGGGPPSFLMVNKIKGKEAANRLMTATHRLLHQLCIFQEDIRM